MQKNRPPEDGLDETFKPGVYISYISQHRKSFDLEKPYGLTAEKVTKPKKTEIYSFSGKGDIITWDDLSNAIVNRVGIEREEARRDAMYVLDIFGFEDRIIDNVLNPADRQLFYILEEEGMVTTDREVNSLYNGREWRTHYWILKKDTILRYANEEGRGNHKIPKRHFSNKKSSGNFSYEDFWKEQDNGKDLAEAPAYDADFGSMTRGKFA